MTLWKLWNPLFRVLFGVSEGCAEFLHQLREIIGWNVIIGGKNKCDILEPKVINWEKNRSVK